MWRLPPKPATLDNFNIHVTARLKPKNESDDVAAPTKAITLPLHQRIQLIRMSKKLSSNKAALNVLKSEGVWFGNRSWKEEGESGTTEENKENKENANATTPRECPARCFTPPYTRLRH